MSLNLKLFAGSVIPSGDVASKETADYSYILSLDHANWTQALELCPMFGVSFYFANIDSASELDIFRPWFTSMAIKGE